MFLTSLENSSIIKCVLAQKMRYFSKNERETVETETMAVYDRQILAESGRFQENL